MSNGENHQEKLNTPESHPEEKKEAWWMSSPAIFIYGVLTAFLIYFVFINRPGTWAPPAGVPLGPQNMMTGYYRNTGFGGPGNLDDDFYVMRNMMDRMFNDDFGNFFPRQVGTQGMMQFSSQSDNSQSSGTLSFAYNGAKMEIPYRRDNENLIIDVKSLRAFMLENSGMMVNLEVRGNNGQEAKQFTSVDDLKTGELIFPSPDGAKNVLLLTVKDRTGNQVIGFRRMI